MSEDNSALYKTPVNPSLVCQMAFELMQTKQYDKAEKLLNGNMARVNDDVAIGLFHSALGVMYKLKGEIDTAWQHYERAEELIPDDPALKIITARLLIERFSEFDKAIKKVKKIQNMVRANPVFSHQVYISLGLAYLGKGKKRMAIEMLNKSMKNDFHGFVTTQNVDFTLAEGLLRQDIGIKECRVFLEKAHSFAISAGEDMWTELVKRMLDAYPKDAE